MTVNPWRTVFAALLATTLGCGAVTRAADGPAGGRDFAGFLSRDNVLLSDDQGGFVPAMLSATPLVDGCSFRVRATVIKQEPEAPELAERIYRWSDLGLVSSVDTTRQVLLFQTPVSHTSRDAIVLPLSDDERPAFLAAVEAVAKQCNAAYEATSRRVLRQPSGFSGSSPSECQFIHARGLRIYHNGVENVGLIAERATNSPWSELSVHFTKPRQGSQYKAGKWRDPRAFLDISRAYEENPLKPSGVRLHVDAKPIAYQPRFTTSDDGRRVSISVERHTEGSDIGLFFDAISTGRVLGVELLGHDGRAIGSYAFRVGPELERMRNLAEQVAWSCDGAIELPWGTQWGPVATPSSG